MTTIVVAWEGGIPQQFASTLWRILETHSYYMSYSCGDITYILTGFNESYNPADPITSLQPHSKSIKKNFQADYVLFVISGIPYDREGYVTEIEGEVFGIVGKLPLSTDLAMMNSKMRLRIFWIT